MANKQNSGLQAPDGSSYVTLTDGFGTLAPSAGASLAVASASLTSAGTLFALTDTSGYNSISVQVTSPGTTCTITYEASEDGTTWYPVVGYTPSNSGTTAPASTSTSAILLVFPLVSKQFRARVSTYTSGTVTAQATLNGAGIPKVGVFATIPALLAGTALVGDVGLSGRATTAGMTAVRVVSAATTNATSTKATAGRLYFGHAVNTTASDKFVKFYNKATAPTVGTDTPVLTLRIPANGQVFIGDAVEPYGYFFSTGIAWALTGAVGDTDTTALAAGDVILHFSYV